MGSPTRGGGAVSSGKSGRTVPKTDVVDTAASPGEVADAATSREHNNLSRSFHDTASEAAAGVYFLNGSEKCSGDTFTRPSSPSLSLKHGSLLDSESDVENNKSKVCTFYAKGWCIKGNTCTFLHHKSYDDVDEMSKTHSGEMNRKVEIHEVAGSAKGVISPALGTVHSSASKLDPCSTRLLVREYGGGISDNQYQSFPRNDLVHNPGILGSDWSSSQSVGDLMHFSLRQGEHNNSQIPSAHGECADRSYSTKNDFDMEDYRQDVLLKQGSSLGESKFFDGRCTADELHISYHQSSLGRANLGYHVKMPFHGNSTDRMSPPFNTKQPVNSRSVGEKDYPFWKPYSVTRNVSPLTSSHAHGPPFSLGLTTQPLPTDWTPSVPFRSSICPISLKPSIGNQHDPFCDSLVSFDGGNRQTAASASSQDAKTEDLAHQLMNVVHEDSEKDKLKKDEQVAVKDDIEDKVLGCKDHKKSVSKKEKRLFDQDRKSSNGSHNLELHTTGSSRQKDSKSLKLFTIALVDYVKELMKPSWREGHLSKDAHKAIVKKSVDKVLNSLQHRQVPLTKESTDEYLSLAQPKLAKLIAGYVEKYSKASANSRKVS